VSKRFKIIIPLCVIVLTYLVWIPNTFAQDQTKIDSLQKVVAEGNVDSALVDALNELAWLHKYSDLDICAHHADSALQVALALKYLRGIANANVNQGIVNSIKVTSLRQLKIFI